MSTDPQSQTPAPASRHVVATYGSYREAERAVDYLSDEGFPVERVAIVGTGLRTVEQVAGRVTAARAALTGATQGALLGVLFALLFGIFFTVAAGGFLGILLYALVVGVLFGAVFGAMGHAAQGGRRDFASVSGMQAERYELQVDAEVADRAREMVGAMPTAEAGATRG
jgi:hypothetical protein